MTHRSRSLLSLLTLLIAGMTFTQQALAQTNLSDCRHGSTQARVKRLGHQPWEQQLTLQCGEAFEVGGFHDQTGQYATDTKIRITGPYFNSESIHDAPISNGQQFRTIVLPGQSYQYTVRVRTEGMRGQGCQETAVVSVHCPRPTPTPLPSSFPSPTPTPLPSCTYGSTQARVKHDSRDASRDQNWQQHLNLRCFDTFEVGGFHDQTGQYADDVTLRVIGPSIDWDRFRNGDRITTTFPGRYQLLVTTKNQFGQACQDTATVRVWCGWR